MILETDQDDTIILYTHWKSIPAKLLNFEIIEWLYTNFETKQPVIEKFLQSEVEFKEEIDITEVQNFLYSVKPIEFW